MDQLRMRQRQRAVRIDEQMLIRRRHEHVARTDELSSLRLTHRQGRAPAEDLGQHTPARGGHVLNKDDGGRKVGRQSREDFTQGRESTG